MTTTSNIVYITKAKINFLVKSIDVFKSDININDFYVKDLSRILSEPEMKKLVLYREVISSPDKFTLDVYVKKTYKDTGRYVYESKSSPSYHKDINCGGLNSNFVNYEIPAEIQHLGANAIEQYRLFFKSNIDLYESNYPAFLAQVGLKFNININNANKVDFSNSGIKEMENISSEKTVERIENEIEIILNKMEEFRNFDEKHRKEIYSYGYATHKAEINGIKQIFDKNSIIYKWHEYKNQLKKLLEDYFRIKLNPDFGFNENILGDLGFAPCHHCCGVDVDSILNF